MKARHRIKNWVIILILGLSQCGLHLWQAMPAPALAQEEAHLWLPIVQRQYEWAYGSISGKVIDSSVSDPTQAALVGAEVCFSPSQCVLTDDTGRFTSELSPGRWAIKGSSDGYYPVTKSAPVYPTQDTTVNFALSPEIGSGESVDLRLVLTWSDNEVWEACPLDPSSCANDLNAHLWVDSLLDAHIQQYPPNPDACSIFPYACLEVATSYGSGPETVAFTEVLTDTPTIYYFGVFNYNQGRPGVPPLIQTGAHLDIYDENGLVMEMEPPAGSDWNFWYVFTMAGETGVISPTNCMALFYPDPVEDFPAAWEAAPNKVCP